MVEREAQRVGSGTLKDLELLWDQINRLETDHLHPETAAVLANIYRQIEDDRAQLSADVRLERAYLDAVLQQLPSGVIIAEAPSGRRLRANTRAEQILGVSLHPTHGIADYDQFRGYAPDGRLYRPREWPLARAILHGETVDNEEIRIQRGDGTLATVLVSAAPIRNPAGEIVAGVAVITDLTARKEAEKSARLALETAARQREEFLYTISHELRTPLTTVKGYTQLLLNYLHRPAMDEQRLIAVARKIEQQTGRLERLIASLLDVTHIQLGSLELRPQLIDLVELTRQVIDQFEPVIDQTGMHHLRLDASEPVVGRWDADRLEQVLSNLISNALVYSPDGGEVRIGAYREGQCAVLTVRDTGLGIEPDVQPRIFEPFLHTRGSRGGIGGAGLGLYITRQFVERHGGTISVESEPGHGSVFTVRLPLAPDDTGRARPHAG